jgi:hypothetical protein
VAIEKKLAKIHQWLSPANPSYNYNRALENCQNGTGSWFLESKQFGMWKTDPMSFLWLYGIPGCGKTILTATIIQQLTEYCADDPEKVVVYFYFDFTVLKSQTPEKMIRSLLCQLSSQSDSILTTLYTLFLSCGNGMQRPSLDQLLAVLHQSIMGLSQTYFVLDALDECTNRELLMEILEAIAVWRLKGLHFLVTSRREHDIESSLGLIIEEQNMICVQSSLVDSDIQNYIRQSISNDKRLQKWDTALADEIEARLIQGAHGMYVYLHIIISLNTHTGNIIK